MSIWAVSVTKKATWKGILEPHSNVYHYKIPLIDGPGSMTVAQAEALLADVVATEKIIMSNSHTYTTGRVWGPVELGQSVSDTVVIKDLSGVGGLSARGPYVSLADCVVISMRTGRSDARSRPVYLRKYMRTLIGPGGGQFGSDQVAQTAGLTTSDLNAANAFADNIAGVDTGTFLNTPGILCSASGATVPSSAPRTVKVAAYLESHELRY